MKVLAFSEELVPSQKYRTKFAAMASLLVKVAPVPWMSVLTARSPPALAFGMFTVGVLPKDPVAVTDEFAVEEEDDEMTMTRSTSTSRSLRGPRRPAGG